MKKYLNYIYPVIAFVLFLIFYSFLESIITNILIYTYQVWFDFFINSNGQELLRQVDIISKNSGEITFLTAFIDLSNINQSPVKNTDIVIFNEIILPIIFYLSFIILFIKRHLKYISISFFTLLFILWFKVIITIYDNYSHPDFILKELIFPFSQIVYYTNSLLSYVGTSFSLMLSVIFIVMFLILKTDLLNKLNVK